MERVQAVSQAAIDEALIVFARYKIGAIRIFDLERAMSYEVGEALAKSDLVRFSIAKMASGRYRISDEGENAITEAGRARLERLRG
ncbi:MULTISPECIES: hypothetical protein [Pseudomonas]|jgi:hypothetical protein|uniref:Uncharacterized protein n=1 Tax=Pseudomonas putida TaxID=303 RepID=A0A2S3WEZ7_PSEPU|nr:hypothetical protein [Pseudomonas putida]POF89218.1 hypothetical protein BGP80_15095 [Pseudomonas putida]